VVKRRAYQRHDVATYWIVDPEAKLVEVWHPADERPEIVTEKLRWHLAPELPPLEIDVAALMKD
jgi:Uma2 family endonuclease